MITLNFTDLVKQRTINLWNKNLSDADLDVVVGVLKQSTVLHFLRLPGNNLTLADGTKHVANALKVNKTLKHLFLHYNYIGDGGAKLIADALIENESLEQLGLYGNSIGVDGAKHLANALKVNKSLEIISLSRNKHIGVEGAKHIANALKVNNTLKELSLCSSKTGVDGAKHIADALIENESLEILSLMGNNVGDEGAKSIADCFYKNQCLRRVELGRNNIGDDGAKKLAEALRWNHGIKWLTIDYDPVSQHIRSEIGEILNEPGRKVPNAQARHLQEVIACKDETIASKNNLIHIKDQELNNQVEVIKGKDTTIEKKNGEIESLKKAMAMIYKQNNSLKAAIRAPVAQLMNIIDPIDLIGKGPEPSNKRARTDDGTARSNLAVMADHNPFKDEMKAVEASINDTKEIKVKKEADDTTDDIYNADADDDNDEAENQENKKQKTAWQCKE